MGTTEITKLRQFSILIQSAPDVDGQWVAHCLNWDVVSQGNSPKHAMEMIGEAILLAMKEDSEAGIDPDGRPQAPREYWDRFSAIFYGGIPVAPANVDRLPGIKSRAFAAFMIVGTIPDAIPMGVRPLASHDHLAMNAPPAFMIAELENHNSAHG